MKQIILAIMLTAKWAAAASNISDTNKYAYGANVGWINFRGDATNGTVAGPFFCTGFVYSANCGWINLGNGPTNKFQYSNASANDFGVNVQGNSLRGFAYGANIGWINFESNGNPRINLLNGTFDGYAYGANVGWIGLSNAFAFVQADRLDTGVDSDGDGIPDAWEISKVGNITNLGANADFDGDGVQDRDEYRADSNPNNISDYLRLTAQGVASGGNTSQVTWASQPSRVYRIERSTSITNNATWADSGLGLQNPDAGLTTKRNVPDGSVTTRFHRVQAIVPLSP